SLPTRTNAMQAVRTILDGKEDDVAVSTGLAGMHGIGRNVNDRARFRFDVLTVDVSVKDAFENVDPLLVGMRMRLGAGARRHAHQADNHPLAFDTGAVCGRVIGTAGDVIALRELEGVVARTGAFGARRARTRGGRMCSHSETPSSNSLRHVPDSRDLLIGTDYLEQ